MSLGQPCARGEMVDDWNPHGCPKPSWTVCPKGSAHSDFTLLLEPPPAPGWLDFALCYIRGPHTLTGALRSAYGGFSWLWRLFSSWFQSRDTLHRVSQRVVFWPCSSFQYSNATPCAPRNPMDGPSRGYQVPMGLPIGVVPRKLPLTLFLSNSRMFSSLPARCSRSLSALT